MTEQRVCANSRTVPDACDLQTSAVTLQGLTGALEGLSWENPDRETWGSITALIRTINKQAIELSDDLALLPEHS